MSEAPEEYISVGKIVRAHGIDGWLVVQVYSGLSDRFDNVKVIYFSGSAGIEGKILSGVQLKGNLLMIRLKGVKNREEAKAFIGKEILLPETQRIELPENTYFIDDLIGIEVIDVDGNFIGILQEVLEMGGNDLYVVRKSEKETLIPAVSEFIKEVDISARKMVVRLWEGM